MHGIPWLPSDGTLQAALISVGGLLLALAALALLWRLARRGGPYRAGPWPGLTFRGAGLLLAHALLLAGTQLMLGAAEVDLAARSALPWLPLVAAGSVGTLVLAARLMCMPGAASAVCGAYLLPRSLASLLVPGLAPPPLLWPPTLALELALWLRGSDVAAVVGVWRPRGPAALRRAWRPRDHRTRAFSARRAGFAGGVFGLLLATLEPAHALFLGSDPARWAAEHGVPAALAAMLAGGLVAGVIGRGSWVMGVSLHDP
jgi:hypothetical protein